MARKALSSDQKYHAKIAYIIGISGILCFLAQFLYFKLKFNTIDDWLSVVIYWITFIMPGYFTNAAMVIVGGDKPIDGGKLGKDGRPLFGPGKTIRGFIFGSLIGAAISIIIHASLFFSWNNITVAVDGFLANPQINYALYQNNRDSILADLSLFLLGNYDQNTSISAFLHISLRILLCAFGAALGDLIGSWAKRRKNLGRGVPFWGIDQLDFICGCLLLAGAFVFIPFTEIKLHVLIMLIIITPTITIAANNFAYLVGWKSVPW